MEFFDYLPETKETCIKLREKFKNDEKRLKKKLKKVKEACDDIKKSQLVKHPFSTTCKHLRVSM